MSCLLMADITLQYQHHMADKASTLYSVPKTSQCKAGQGQAAAIRKGPCLDPSPTAATRSALLEIENMSVMHGLGRFNRCEDIDNRIASTRMIEGTSRKILQLTGLKYQETLKGFRSPLLNAQKDCPESQSGSGRIASSSGSSKMSNFG